MIKVSIALILLLFFGLPLAQAGPGSFENESNPMEQSDMKTIEEINNATAIENESTPIEQEDSKTIEQVNQSTDSDRQSNSAGKKESSNSVDN
jgi:hypothetical protein